MLIQRFDDLGDIVTLPSRVRRVVSLVPSLTEYIADLDPSLLVGATDWCTHPGDLDVTRVRGTKNPDTRLIASLNPDLVVVNKEENREIDVRRMRDAGVPVWVTDIRSVPGAFASIRRLTVDALDRQVPLWVSEAERLWGGDLPPVVERAAVCIWRDPWMVVGSSTFTGDLLRRVGVENIFANHPERYPSIELDRIDAAGADVVLLPDEPYTFTPEDGPEAFSETATRVVSGRLLTWYGPSMVEAYAELRGAGLAAT